ncbi:MAG: 4Fe-4S binding protein, partial [Peptococcaceae bacterium]|nr:4Fe-4S binding protein [Peptococcaceae bacterium]
MSRMYWHRLKNRLSFQRWSQLGFILLINSYAKGFQSGQIFAGASKSICVPVLNCYSCPGALGACPIGALQTVLGRGRFPFYVLGLMMAFGVVLGRAICGLLCPFGLVQDLLHKIPLPKYQLPPRLDRALRWLKYIVLALLVVLLPLLAAIQSGIATPYFCKWLCPAGTLGGALPLMATNPSLRALAGALFGWKFAVLVLIVFAAILIPRPFCRYLCPLGAFYSFFNRVSFYGITLEESRCTSCGRCAQVCP